MTPPIELPWPPMNLVSEWHDNVGAVFDRPHQVGRRQRIVDDQRNAVFARDLGNRLDVDELAARICQALDEDGAGFGVDLAFEGGNAVDIGPAHLPAVILESSAELVDRAAVEFSCRDEILARPHDTVEDQVLRRVARRSRKRRRAALERCDLLFQHGLGRVHDAGVDVAEGLQPEQRGRMVGVLEDEAVV